MSFCITDSECLLRRTDWVCMYNSGTFFSVKVLRNYMKHTGRRTSHSSVQNCVHSITYSQQDIYFDLGIVRPSALLLLIAARVAARWRGSNPLLEQQLLCVVCDGDGSMGDAARGVDLTLVKSVQNKPRVLNGYGYCGSGAANRHILILLPKWHFIRSCGLWIQPKSASILCSQYIR